MMTITSPTIRPRLNAAWIADDSVLLVRTKNEPITEAMIPIAAMTNGTRTALITGISGNATAAVSAARSIVAMIEPTYDS